MREAGPSPREKWTLQSRNARGCQDDRPRPLTIPSAPRRSACAIALLSSGESCPSRSLVTQSTLPTRGAPTSQLLPNPAHFRLMPRPREEEPRAPDASACRSALTPPRLSAPPTPGRRSHPVPRAAALRAFTAVVPQSAGVWGPE